MAVTCMCEDVLLGLHTLKSSPIRAPLCRGRYISDVIAHTPIELFSQLFDHHVDDGIEESVAVL